MRMRQSLLPRPLGRRGESPVFYLSLNRRREHRVKPSPYPPEWNSYLLRLVEKGGKPVELDCDSSITLWRSPFSSWSIHDITSGAIQAIEEPAQAAEDDE
ncbi:hypothetical protein L2E82_53171 [Cichorium intybus]|nr:hypothetical protein L2E82_53171 [Cichorium intybus]